jgi:radical SAM-linked protein
MIVRAIRRAGLPVRYSQGFHPMPKISFEDPLPIGMQSMVEKMYVTLAGHVGCQDVTTLLNRELPEGLEIKNCVMAGKRKKQGAKTSERYRIQLIEGRFDQACLDRFKLLSEFPYFKVNKKGKRKVFDLKETVDEIKINGPRQLVLKIRKKAGKTLRPSEILSELFKLSEEEIKQAIIVKEA